MKWRTEIEIQRSERSISHDDFILGMGSCFADNVGKKFRYFGFGVETNPTGILYNVTSIRKMLEYMLELRQLEDSGFVDRDGLMCHHDFHFDFRASTREAFKEKLGQAQKEFQEKWERVGLMVLTLGTANIYRKGGEGVANCHKQPSRIFSKELQSIEEIEGELMRIREIVEERGMIVTVSPVRHLRDGFIENQLSKAHLISAIHKIGLEYFPSYEIVLDDLRDYRFYREDLVHPSDDAIDYVWSKFAERYFSDATKQLMDKVEKYRKLKNHKAFNPESEASQNVLLKSKALYEDLSSQLKYLEE